MNAIELSKAKNGDLDAQARLIEENAGLIWSIVRRFVGRGVEQEDLYQLGCIGFLKAMQGYDPVYGTQFSTYAVPKIAGEMRRFLRDDGAVKVSRTVKEQAAAVKAARSRLASAYGREPTVSELAKIVGISEEEIAAAELATAQTESLQESIGEEGFSLESVLSGSDTEEKLLENLTLKAAMKSLSEKERMVLSLRYDHALTQAKAAEVIGVSQVQVSRIERKAILRLRQYFSCDFCRQKEKSVVQ